jgi:heme/copper-type cytochrome/quinol oxidase subunit 3
VFLLSESVVFPVLGWVVCTGVVSPGPVPGYESILIPEPCELTYGTALLLGVTGMGVGTGCTGRVPLGVFHWNPYSSLTGTLVFTSIQVGEFGVLGVYTSDSCTGSTYTSTSGLHLIHVLGGTVLVGVSSGTGYSLEVVPGDTVPRDIYSIMEYSYWHLVEVVYIYIYLCLYYHYQDIPLYPPTLRYPQAPPGVLLRCRSISVVVLCYSLVKMDPTR